MSCHCEPTGRCEAPPDDRLREAIHLRIQRKQQIASSLTLLAITGKYPRAFGTAVVARRQHQLWRVSPLPRIRQWVGAGQAKRDVFVPGDAAAVEHHVTRKSRVDALEKSGYRRRIDRAQFTVAS
jgi:hypothetical protein